MKLTKLKRNWLKRNFQLCIRKKNTDSATSASETSENVETNVETKETF